MNIFTYEVYWFSEVFAAINRRVVAIAVLGLFGGGLFVGNVSDAMAAVSDNKNLETLYTVLLEKPDDLKALQAYAQGGNQSGRL